MSARARAARLAPLLLIAVVLLGAVPRARAADTDAGASQILRATLDNGLKVLRSIPLSESSMDRIARGLTSRAAAGLPLDEPTRAAARYLALTPEDVRAAFAKWIRPQDLVQVTEGPNPR